MIEYRWLVEGHIVIFSGNSEIMPEDIAKENDVLAEFLTNGSGSLVHVIGDDRNLTEFPPLEALNEAEWIKHDKLGYFIIVGMSDVISKMKSSIVATKQKIRFRLVDTMEEALDILEYADVSLPKPLKEQIPEDILSGQHLEKYKV